MTMNNLRVTPQDKTALKALYDMIWRYKVLKYPGLEIRHIVPPMPYNLKKTNDLEKAICKWFEMEGYKAERVKTQGRRIGSDVVYHNPITGKVQCIDKAKYIPSTGAKGSADISVTCRDKERRVMSLRIEVKNGYTNDRMRPDQERYRQEHEASGGTYLIVRYFSDFVSWYNENVITLNPKYLPHDTRKPI